MLKTTFDINSPKFKEKIAYESAATISVLCKLHGRKIEEISNEDIALMVSCFQEGALLATRTFKEILNSVVEV